MLRNILVTIAGTVIGMMVIALLEAVGHHSFPVPGLSAEMTHEEVRQFLVLNQHLIPIGAFIMVLLGHALGAFSGVFIAGRFAKDSDIPSSIVFVLMLCATIANLFMVPHPSWFAFTDVIGVLFAGYAGLSIGRKGRKGISINPRPVAHQSSRS